MEASHKNFQVIVKNVHTFDGKSAAGFIEWHEKIHISLNIYNKAAFRVLKRATVPSAAADTDGCKVAAWNTANKDLDNVLFFTRKGAACIVVRRFAGKILDEGSGHGQHAWAALREKFDGCLREALRAEHTKMNSANESGSRPRRIPVRARYSPRTPQCVRPSRETGGPSIRGHHPPSSSAGIRAHPHIPSREARLRDRRHSPHDVRYLCGQPFPSSSTTGIAGRGAAISAAKYNHRDII